MVEYYTCGEITANKPTLNIAQLIHVLYQIENLTGHSADELVDMIFSGNTTASVKTLFLDTFERVKNQPLDVGMNAALYAIIYKAAKKAIGPRVGSIDLVFFRLKPI